MEPRIHYAKTSDDVSIAYWAIGTGPVLVLLSPTASHIQLEWRVQLVREVYSEFARHHTVVRYDHRGYGLSQRDDVRFGLDAFCMDIEAVLDDLGVQRCSFCAYGGGGIPAIAFAALHPERVERLALWDAIDSYQGLGAQFRAMRTLAAADYGTYTETFANVLMGWDVAEDARQYATLLRASIEPEMLAQFFAAELDVTDLLPELKCPTLVGHAREATAVPMDMVRRLASRIPEAHMVLVEGKTPFATGGREALRITEEFLGGNTDFVVPAATSTPSAVSTGLRAVLFTDLASSTALTQRLGDEKAQELVRAHNSIVREVLASQGGTEFKHTGDGIMASFATASGAPECAVAIERRVTLHNEPDLQVHIGLNAGEPVAEESDLFGTSVQLARRICDQAEAGQILTSNVVRELAAGKGFLFSDIGDVVPKGFEEPVRLYEVRWRKDA